MTANMKLACQLVVSVCVILPFWGFVFLLFFYARSIDPSVRDTITQITGALIAAFGAVIGFWIGTSLSSAAKDSTIEALTSSPVKE